MGKQKIGELKKQVLPTLKKYDVIKASIFGSYARGEQTKRSDIDMMVQFKGKKSLLDLVGLEQDLQDKIGIKFDVMTYNSVNHLIRDRVMAEQIQIL